MTRSTWGRNVMCGEALQALARPISDACDRIVVVKVAEPNVDEGLRHAFEELALSWSADTAHLSSPIKLMKHPAYQRIIGLGPPVLPLILKDLARNGGFWFPALSAITGENPVPDDAAGDIDRMTHAWMEWGHENGLV